MSLLTLQQIRDSRDLVPTRVSVPEWGGDVNVYPLTGSQVEDMQAWHRSNPAGVGYEAKLLSMACRDLGASFDDMRAIVADKCASATKRLVEAAEQLAFPSSEELVKNSESGTSDESG